MTVSLGVAGALGPAAIARIAASAEAAGLAGLWVNDTPDGDALSALAAAAGASDRLVLASGVVPLDRRPASEIAAAVAPLPAARTVLGIGSGAARAGALDRVSDAVRVLRKRTTVRLVVGALGPRMRRRGATEADGILLNWLTPEAAARQAAEAHAANPGAHVALYVRTALTPDAVARLDAETARYASFPNYAANFERLGIAASDTVIRSRNELDRRLPQYEEAVDEVVLRAITATDDASQIAAFIAAAGVSAGRGPAVGD